MSSRVDAAERGFKRRDHVDQAVDVLLVDLDVEDVDARELLEQDGLAFHHRLGGKRPDVAQAEHCSAVGDHRDQVAARRVAERVVGIGDDLLAGGRHAWRVGQRQVALVDHLLGRGDGQLARCRVLVVLERGAAQFPAAFLGVRFGVRFGVRHGEGGGAQHVA
jgi:hypothetical protein